MVDEQEVEITDPTQPNEVVSLDIDEDPDRPEELEPETTLELLRQAGNESYREEIGRGTSDRGIQEALAKRQELAAGGDRLHAMDAERTAVSPDLSGGDVDAAWNQANVAGEETVGGTTPTPDQDRVDALGAAVGLTYADDEPLEGGEKLRRRDENRWELMPESQIEE